MLEKDKVIKLTRTAAGAGYTLGQDHDGTLYALLESETGKTSIHDLTDAEYKAIYSIVAGKLYGQRRFSDSKSRSAAPGMMTGDQISRFFVLFSQLEKLSPTSKVGKDAKRERQAEIIKYALKIDVDTKQDLFRWIDQEDGSKLIETIKGLVASERRKHIAG